MIATLPKRRILKLGLSVPTPKISIPNINLAAFKRLGDPSFNRLGIRGVPWGLGRGPQGQSYIDKVLGIDPANLIAYWPLNEDSGTNADNIEGTAARDGTYANDVSVMGTNDGIGDGNTAPIFTAGDGDFVDVYSASLNAAFNNAEGTFSLWYRVLDASGWDGFSFWRVGIISADASNLVQFTGDTGGGNFEYQYGAGGVFENNFSAGNSHLTWDHYAITWSVAADEVRSYQSGAQVVPTRTVLGAWVGALLATGCVIGARSTVPTNPTTGEICHANLWTAPLPLDQIEALATV